jgi:hypothetical protein
MTTQATRVALMFGYALLGRCLAVLKTGGELQQWARRVERVCLIAVLIAIPGREHLDTADAVQYGLVVIRFLQPSTQANTAQSHALWRPREHPVADTSKARQIDCQA